MSRQISLVQVVVGIVYNSHQHILIAQRPSNKPFAGYWEFPGGKVEQGEDPVVALKREYAEEIGIEILHVEPFKQLFHQDAEKNLSLLFYKVINFRGEPKGLEGQEIKWVSASELSQYTFPPANAQVIAALL